MAYISSPNHFINYINKIIKHSEGIEHKNILDAESYIALIYQKGLQDRYSWDIKEDPKLLENDNMMQWLSKNNAMGSFLISSELEHVITAQFSSIIKDLKNSSGVYSFWTKSDTPLYVGMSIDLQSRVPSSFSERFSKYKKPVYFKYITTEFTSDAALLEVYFICKLKPALNGTSKYSDPLSTKLKKEPKFSKPILCNRIKEKKQNASR